MKRVIWFVLLLLCSISSYAQETDNLLVKNVQLIKAQQGDSIARVYLESKRDSLEQQGETPSYILLWGLLTSNMWNANPTESLKHEYKEYLDAVIDDEIKADDYMPVFEFLPSLWQLVHDYYNMLYQEGDKETTLQLLLSIHRWFKPYAEAKKTISYAQSLLDLCLILVRDMHKYNEGETFCREYACVAKNVYGDNSAQYAIALYNIAILPQIQADEKKSFLNQAISIYEKACASDPAIMRQMRQELKMQTAIITGVTDVSEIEKSDIISIEDCTTLVVSGKGDVALQSLLQYKDKIKNEEYADTIRYAAIVNLLANVYMQMGDFASAQREIESFNQEIGISIGNLPAEYVQTFFSSAGLIAYRLKDYPKALRYCHAACSLLEKAGNYGVEYSKNLANIAMIYAEAGEYLDANFYLDSKWYIDEALSVFEERIGPLRDHGNVGITLLSNAALVYEAIGDREEAVSTLESIVKDFCDNIDVQDAWTLAVNNLAAMYMKQGKWADAEQLLASLNSHNDNNMYLFSQNLALCRMYLNDKKKTAEALEEMNNYARNNIAGIFSFFAGVERSNYWTQISKELIFTNNLVAYHTNDNQAQSIAYNNALFCKSLLQNSSRILDIYIANLTDAQLQTDYNIYKNLKTQLAFKTEDAFKKDSLSHEITKYEKRLLEAIGNLGELLKKESRTWQDVKASLADDEIAIEFCYAPRMEHYPDVQPYYGAFVMRKDFDHPVLVSLENVDSVEAVFDNIESDELLINNLYASNKSITLHNMLWNKILPYMNGVRKVYYSPTGYLNNINFEVLRDETGVMLNEKYTMCRVSSTANISDVKASEGVSYQSSALYGNIKYDESMDAMAEASSAYNEYSGTEIGAELALRSENERGKWGPIPSTKKEIENIYRLLKGKGVSVSVFDSIAANEESFKSLHRRSPDILHLATHGFVIDTPQKAKGNKFVATTNIYSQKDSYLMWAGLMLAGGNNIWQGKFNLTNVEDGILTADEISRLDLSNTKLVVLSACETARGKVDPVDGVYGLQRAFKLAGVQTIVMSLWKVQDDATAMLMTQFYKYLTDGMEKHQALWNAMMDVRKKYKDPYYWAGLVMLD